VVVGTVPCNILLDNRQLIFSNKECVAEGSRGRMSVRDTVRSKCLWLVSPSDREIVGPGYFAQPVVTQDIASKCRVWARKGQPVETANQC
jgi:hypothetical protein